MTETIRNAVKQSQFNLATAFAKQAVKARSLPDVTSAMLWLNEMYGSDEAAVWTVDHLMPQIDEGGRAWLKECLKEGSDRSSP